MFKIIKIALIASFFLGNATVVYADPPCKETSKGSIANRIANGHSWGKHKDEFVAGKKMAGLAMPDKPKITSSGEFKDHISKVMSGSSKKLERGRAAYWDKATGTIVIHDPNSVDCGTAFRPTAGESYYNSTK